MQIGEVAHRTGLTAKTIRYYEEIELLPKPPRTESGYRDYSESDVSRLQFVKKARRLGLSLAEAGWVLDLRAQDGRPCHHVVALLDRKLAEIDDAIAGLTTFRTEMNELRDSSVRDLESAEASDEVCGIIERGVHHQGEVALAWLESRNLARSTR